MFRPPGLRLGAGGGCGPPKVTPPAPGRRAARRARPGPIPPQLGSRRPPQPLECRLPPCTAGPGPGLPSKGARPLPPRPEEGVRPVRPPCRPHSPGGPGAASAQHGGPGCVLTAAGTRCLSPSAWGRPMSERGCREDATRPWLLRRNSAVFLPPGPPLPRGGGDSRRPYPGRGAGLGLRRGGPRWEAADQPLSCGPCGARPGRAGPRSRRGPPSERGEGPRAV